MPDKIKLLPDSVANQIAAGEVIQRPASIIKELVENAIDAGGNEITIIVKEAGRSLVQIIDNGSGMSETDARMAFERHATSKISVAEDLYHLSTRGFRGEALASIAAVAQVELKTRRANDEMGTEIHINGSKLEKQVPCACAVGSNFCVKNLFYNIPVRRKFLKSNNVEFRHILTEIERIVLVNPTIRFVLYHNGDLILDLEPATLKQRITQVFGKNIPAKLLSVHVDTIMAKITGFVGTPETARKKGGEQFFFVNGRYMRHPYFHRAVMNAYENLLDGDSNPSYFLYFEVEPSEIDVNIHPTKTEIKFENESALFPIVIAAVRESLGKFNLMPSIDFDTENVFDIPLLGRSSPIIEPEVTFNPRYNPFDGMDADTSSDFYKGGIVPSDIKSSVMGWDALYSRTTDIQKMLIPDDAPIQMFRSEPVDDGSLQDFCIDSKCFMQFRGRFIITTIKSGLLFIDQQRAHTRVQYEKILESFESGKVAIQKLLFPYNFDLSFADAMVLSDMREKLQLFGLEIDSLGRNSFVINGVPALVDIANPVELVEQLIEHFRTFDSSLPFSAFGERVAAVLANKAAIKTGKQLSQDEMQDLVEKLFRSSNPNYTPEGKLVMYTMNDGDIEKFFK